MLTIILLGTLYFALFLALHVFIFHNKPPKRRFRTLIYLLVLSCFLFILTYILFNIFGVTDKINNSLPTQYMSMAAGLFVFFFCWYFYAHLVVVFDRSVTPRMMVEIYKAENKKITIEQMKKEYSLEEKFRHELDDMDIMHRIKKDGDYYYNTPKGIAHGKVIEWLRDYLHIGGHQ